MRFLLIVILLCGSFLAHARVKENLKQRQLISGPMDTQAQPRPEAPVPVEDSKKPVKKR